MSHHHLGRILTPNSRQSHQRASIYYRPPVLFVTRPCARASPLVQFETKAAANIPHRVAALTSSLFKAGPNISRGLRMLSFPKLALQGMWIVAALVCSSNGAQASIQQVSPLPPAADMPISACSTCPPQMLFPEELLGAQPCAFGFMRGCIEDPTTLPPDHPNNPALGPVSPFATPPTGGCDQVRCLGVCYEWVTLSTEVASGYPKPKCKAVNYPCTNELDVKPDGRLECDPPEPPCKNDSSTAFCVVFPPMAMLDGNGNGVHDLDEEDPYDPRPADNCRGDDLNCQAVVEQNPWGDPDHDGIPNAYDWDAFGDGKVSGPGIIPGFVEWTDGMFEQFLAHQTSRPPGASGHDFRLADFVDLNVDGMVTVGELAGRMFNIVRAQDIAGAYRPTQPEPQAFRDKMRESRWTLLLASTFLTASGFHDQAAYIADILGRADRYEIAIDGLRQKLENEVAPIVDAYTGERVINRTEIRYRLSEEGIPGLEIVALDENDLVVPWDELDDRLRAKYESVWEGSNVSLHGDPVDTANGAFFHKAVDLVTHGTSLDFALERVYFSHSTQPGLFGHGWKAPLLETRITWLYPTEDGASHAAIEWGDGRVSRMRYDPGGSVFFEGVDGEFGKLQSYRAYLEAGALPDCDDNDAHLGGSVFRSPTGELFFFCPPTYIYGDLGVSVSFLRKVSDSHGNSVVIRRNERGNPVEVFDSTGKQVAFQYGPNGLVESVTGPDGSVWNYTYSADNDLLLVESPPTQYVNQAGAYVTGRPYEAYEYLAPADAGVQTFDDTPELRHLLKGVFRTGSVPSVELEYNYDPAGDFYNYTRVRAQVVDGYRTEYRYTRFEGDWSPPASAPVLAEEPDQRVEILHADGSLIVDKRSKLPPGGAADRGGG